MVAQLVVQYNFHPPITPKQAGAPAPMRALLSLLPLCTAARTIQNRKEAKACRRGDQEGKATRRGELTVAAALQESPHHHAVLHPVGPKLGAGGRGVAVTVQHNLAVGLWRQGGEVGAQRQQGE